MIDQPAIKELNGDRSDLRYDFELSMAGQYGMQLSKQDKQRFEAWNKTYLPDAWEVERNKRIALVQGNSNPFISLEIVK